MYLHTDRQMVNKTETFQITHQKRQVLTATITTHLPIRETTHLLRMSQTTLTKTLQQTSTTTHQAIKHHLEIDSNHLV
jgi:hypothetical protein